MAGKAGRVGRVGGGIAARSWVASPHAFDHVKVHLVKFILLSDARSTPITTRTNGTCHGIFSKKFAQKTNYPRALVKISLIEASTSETLFSNAIFFVEDSETCFSASVKKKSRKD